MTIAMDIAEAGTERVTKVDDSAAVVWEEVAVVGAVDVTVIVWVAQYRGDPADQALVQIH